MPLILAFGSQRPVTLYEFKANPLYIASFRSARALKLDHL